MKQLDSSPTNFRPTREVFFVGAVLAAGFLLRIWRFVESGEIDEDEAFLFGRSMMLLNRETIWGWISVFETDYGLGVLVANAANFLSLRALSIPVDERTIQYASLVFGTLGPVTVYLAAREILQDYRPALAVAVLVAVIPSQVVQSRSIAGNWMVATCLFWLVVFCLARYARHPTGQWALYSGLALAVYLQSDGLQLVLLAILPFLLGLLGEHRTADLKGTGEWAAAGCVMCFVTVAALTNPTALRLLLGSDRTARWSSAVFARLEVYTVVFAGFAVLVVLLSLLSRMSSLPLQALWLKIAHPLLLVPVLASLALNVAVAASTARVFGVPRGVLGHALAKDSALGFYGGPYLSDIVGILGWPLTVYTFLFLVPAVGASLRSRACAALDIICLLTSLPWLLAVPPHSTGRAWYMLTCSTALTAFATMGLFETARFSSAWLRAPSNGPTRTRRLLPLLATLVLTTMTLPSTLAQVTQTPVLGVSMPWKNGTNLPSKGTRAAFEYFIANAGTSDTLFTDSPLWTPRFYLCIKSSRNFSKDLIRALPYMQRRQILTYFEAEGRTADWYIVSSGFVQKLGMDRLEGMGLRAIAEASGGTTEIWQRGYNGRVAKLTVERKGA